METIEGFKISEFRFDSYRIGYKIIGLKCTHEPTGEWIKLNGDIHIIEETNAKEILIKHLIYWKFN